MLSLKISNFVAIMLDSKHIKYKKTNISHNLGQPHITFAHGYVKRLRR